MTCRRVITGFSTQTLHSFFKGEIPEIFPATFRHSFFDPLKLLPHGSEAKAIHSHLVAPPNSPSVWVSKFQPRFWVDFFGGLNFQTQFGGFRAQKMQQKMPAGNFISMKGFLGPPSIVQIKCHLFFKFATSILFWGNLFGGNLFLLEIYIISNTQIFTKRRPFGGCCLEDAHHGGLSFFQGLLGSLGKTPFPT